MTVQATRFQLVILAILMGVIVGTGILIWQTMGSGGGQCVGRS